MQNYEFKLPDIGEGVAEGEVLKWFVSEGEEIREDQPLVEVMTDKVNIEIPSPKAGKVSKILAKAGDVVRVGQSLVLLEVQPESEVRKAVPSNHGKYEAKSESPITNEVGTLATPATRKLAHDLGVNIDRVVGSGPEGRVTIADVRRAAEEGSSPIQVPPGQPNSLASDNREERIPLRGIRKTIAQRMAKSAHTAAQVTHVDEVDVTELVLVRNKLREVDVVRRSQIKLTFLPMFIRSVIPALKEFPYVNALFDDDAQEIVLKGYYNIGIATDTDQGLVVPVIRDAEKKNIFDLAVEIEALVAKARAGRLSLDEVRDSTFTITSVGSVGGLFSTPLINYPEVAIIGIQRIVKRPIVKDGAITIREMMNLTLSFDHRVIDGAYAARFLNTVIGALERASFVESEADH